MGNTLLTKMVTLKSIRSLGFRMGRHSHQETLIRRKSETLLRISSGRTLVLSTSIRVYLVDGRYYQHRSLISASSSISYSPKWRHFTRKRAPGTLNWHYGHSTRWWLSSTTTYPVTTESGTTTTSTR